MAITHPWPDSAGEPRRCSIAEVRAALENAPVSKKTKQDDLDAIDLEIDLIAGAVSARIERYAPNAPAPMKDEALIRAVAWLQDSRGAMHPGGIANLSIRPIPENQSRWFRLSGTMGLLSQWRMRNAGVAEE